MARKITTRIAACASLAAAFALLACGDDSAGTPDASVLDGADVGSGDAVDGPAACVDNLECRGGEVCRDGFCRDACESDGECAEGQDCDLTSGVCVDRECSVAADCRGGFDCVDGQCVSIDPVICEGETSRCSDDGLAVIDCSRDGTSESQSTCEPGAICVVDGATAACTELVCTPNEVSCLDLERAALCDPTGTSFTELPCRDDQFCDAGVCRVRVCEPSSAVCDGTSVVACDELGGEATVTACADTVDCASTAFGCACVDGACEPRACVAGTSRCAGSGFQTCDAEGLGYGEVTVCDEGDVCVAGGCLPTLCDAGARECVGDTVAVCNSDGTSRSTIDCTATGRVCSLASGTAECAARACVPDAVACDASGFSVVACNGRGTAQTTTPCPAGNYCSSGVCLTQACAPGSALTCVAGDVQRCNRLGSAYELVDDCSATTERCSAGACQPLACTATAVRCVGERLGTCAADGLSETFVDCAASSGFCDASALVCRPRACVPNEVSCTAGDVFTCDSRGSTDTLTNDCSSRLGCAAGACVIGCGDGVVQTGELCDDGNLDESDDCLNTCRYSDSGSLGQWCIQDSDCGDEQWCPTGAWVRRCAPIALAGTANAMRFSYVPAGTFSMGSATPGEDPIHDVTVSAFFMATTPTTQGQWTALGFPNPSYFNSAASPTCTASTCPVERINWWEAAYYANELSESEGLELCYSFGTTSGTIGAGCTGTSCSAGAFAATSIGFVGRSCTGYRLPSEAEWELAATADTTSTYYWGESVVTSFAGQYAWFSANAGGRTHEVGQRISNDFGLYDMSGNVHQWVWDFVVGYSSGALVDPFGPPTGTYRGGRGGSWTDAIEYIRPRYRYYSIPANRSNHVGMRLVRSAP